MPNIMDYESTEAWQEAWNAWNEAQRAERQARIRAARSNAAQRGAATRKRNQRHSTRCRMPCDSRDFSVTRSGGQSSCT